MANKGLKTVAVTVAMVFGAQVHAQTMSDAIPDMTTGQALYFDAHNQAETAREQCRQTVKDTSQSAEGCFQSLQDAIRSIARYQLHVSQNREDVFLSEAVGEVGREIMVSTGDLNRMGRLAMVEGVYKDIQDNLVLADDRNRAILQADHALKAIFVYGAQDSLGVHPAANKVGDVVVALAEARQREQDFLTPAR